MGELALNKNGFQAVGPSEGPEEQFGSFPCG